MDFTCFTMQLFFFFLFFFFFFFFFLSFFFLNTTCKKRSVLLVVTNFTHSELLWLFQYLHKTLMTYCNLQSHHINLTQIATCVSAMYWALVNKVYRTKVLSCLSFHYVDIDVVLKLPRLVVKIHAVPWITAIMTISVLFQSHSRKSA